MASVRAMYVNMADDEQADKINEGKAAMQVHFFSLSKSILLGDTG